MSSFDVRVFAIRRRPGRRMFEVRWRVAGRDKSRSFITRALADSYHAELVRAARRGQEFSPATGEPAAWATPERSFALWLAETWFVQVLAGGQPRFHQIGRLRLWFKQPRPHAEQDTV